MGDASVTPLLATQRSIFGHEFALQAEKTVTDMASTCLRYAATSVLIWKAMDQHDFMAVYDIDPHTGRAYPSAIADLASWQAAVAEAAQSGVTLIPWVVPGHPDQAAAHAQLGPILVVDAEPYRGFWLDSPGNFVAYVKALVAAGVTELYISTDPRRTAENALDERELAGSVAGWLPQVYWTDFQQAAVPTVSDMLDPFFQLGGVVIPVLPFDGSNEFAAFYAVAQSKGCPSPSYWRLGSGDVASLQTLARLPIVPPVDPCAQQVAALQQQMSDLESQLVASQNDVAGRQTLLDQIAALATQ